MLKDIRSLKGYCLEGGALISSLLFSSKEWAVYKTNQRYNILLVREELLGTWRSIGFEAVDLFEQIEIAGDDYFLVRSDRSYTLAPVWEIDRPFDVYEALSFAASFVRGKKVFPDSDLGNSLFWESQSILLPLPQVHDNVPEEVMLGMWLTGGVRVSVSDFKRIIELTNYMEPGDLAYIYMSLGCKAHIPSNYQYLIAKRPKANIKLEGNHEDDTDERTWGKHIDNDFFLPGQSELTSFINDYIVEIVKHPQEYSRMGVLWPPSFILYGEPGTGKSYAVDKLAKYLGWPYYNVSSKTIASSYIHETSRLISDVFEKAISTAPSVLVIDELDSFLSDRLLGGAGGHHVEEVNEFLRRIPEAISKGVLVIGITNLIGLIDQAAIRKGRFDHVVEVSLPNSDERLELLSHATSSVPIDDSVDLKFFSEKLDGCSPADISFFVTEAGRLSVRNRKESIDLECFNDSLLKVMRSKKEKKRRIGFL